MEPLVAAAAAPAPLPTAPPLVELPQDLIELTVSFLPQHDLGSALQLSREMYQAIAPAIRTLTTPQGFSGSAAALRRLLRRLPDLQGLEIEDEQATQALMDAFGDGSIGGKLTKLAVPINGGLDIGPLITHLENGRLPVLTELSATFCRQDGDAVADALEARMTLGLAPLARLGEVFGVDVDSLRRLLGCRGPAAAELSAFGGLQLVALAEFVEAHESLPALESLYLSADTWVAEEDDDAVSEAEEEAMTVAVPRILQRTTQGCFFMLQELKLESWTDETPSLALLGQAIAEGKLPDLSLLDIRYCTLPSEQFRAIVDALNGPHGKLLRLSYGGFEFAEEDLDYLAGALTTAGGGLSQLEELKLFFFFYDKPVDSILVALPDGAPCAATLQVLDVQAALTAASLRTFFEAFGRAAFPRLTKLRLGHNAQIDEEAAHIRRGPAR